VRNVQAKQTWELSHRTAAARLWNCSKCASRTFRANTRHGAVTYV